jgi:3-deoxy-D-manno-octulosonic-acid transferase
MSKIFCKFLYYLFVSPLIILTAHILSLFSKTIREGLIPRYKVFQKIRVWNTQRENHNVVIVFHAASLGEFEHIKPLLNVLYHRQNSLNVVTFFSPSGYNHARTSEAMHLKLYMPFDLPFLWSKFYNMVKPKMILIAKHDVWPAQIWIAHRMGIPLYLINASLSEKSSRTRWYIKSFLKHVYRDFTKICAISEEDKMRFDKHYPRCPVLQIGDTKYDQVVLRKKEAEKSELLSDMWQNNKWIFVAGSVWPEDTQHLFPALKTLMKKYNHLHVIIVPHQPHPREIERIENEFDAWKTCKYSERSNLNDQRVLIIDVVGLLAALYNNAHAAYVGGSFKQGVHNVMEPAIYGIPVIYGPSYNNSYEAIQLRKEGGGIVINDAIEFKKQLNTFIIDEKRRIITGKKAADFAKKNTGATKKLLELWKSILSKV